MKKVNRKIFSKKNLIFGVGAAAFTLVSQAFLIYRERQGELSAAFPEIENEINEAVNAVRCEREATVNE